MRQRIPRPRELAVQLGAGLWRRRRGIASLSIAAGLLAAGYGAGRYVATSDRFAVASIELHGADNLSPEELHERLGYLAGRNIFRSNLARAEARLAKHPWVESVSLRRALPNGLVAQVVEREPAAVAHLDGMYLIDAQGVPFARVAAGDDRTAGLVSITGIDRDSYARDPDQAHERLRQAVAAIEAYANGERPPLGEVHLGARGQLRFSTYDDAVAIRADVPPGDEVSAWLRGFDAAWDALDERERATARLFRIQGSGAPERVTVDFSGLTAGY